MREIKFKAELNKKIYFVEDIEFGGDVGLIDKYGIRLRSYTKYINLLQYTGLKDKNGQEIYEGDIVKSETILGKEKYLGQISFFNGCYIIGLGNPIKAILCHCNEPEFKAEIVGNIYENPELLGRN